MVTASVGTPLQPPRGFQIKDLIFLLTVAGQHPLPVPHSRWELLQQLFPTGQENAPLYQQLRILATPGRGSEMPQWEREAQDVSLVDRNTILRYRTLRYFQY